LENIKPIKNKQLEFFFYEKSFRTVVNITRQIFMVIKNCVE